MRRLLLFFVLAGLSIEPIRASYYLSPDVPTTRGTTFLPSDVVLRTDGGFYVTQFSLPSGTAIDGLYLMTSGNWLLSIESPAPLGGITYDPRDVIRTDGAGGYTLFLNGAAAGIPAGSNVDALFLDGGDAGDLILSFDVPTIIGGVTYDPADLVRLSGGTFSLFFDASATSPPIPTSTNVTGAGRRGPRTFLTFDVPTTLGPSTYLPGQLVTWDGTAFASFAADSAWPVSSSISALALGPCLDGDDDGYGLPGDPGCRAGAVPDCDDTSATIYPGAPQVCDGINNDCADPAWPAVPAAELDADGDGFRACFDCDDTNPTVRPGAPQLCDGINNNCFDPAWPAVPANEADADGDGVRICAGDCNDADPAAWRAPGEVAGLALADTTLSWDVVADPGGAPALVRYDVIRSTNRNDFVTIPPATCIESDDASDTTAVDIEVPPLDSAFFYLIRAENTCPGTSGVGSLGTKSDGVQRTARVCP